MKSSRWFWPMLGAALFVIGITVHGNWWIGSIGVIVLLLSLGATLNRRKDGALRSASPGSVRVETVKQQWANQTVQQYAQAGWVLDGQSSAKSLGSQARVTLTFRKP